MTGAAGFIGMHCAKILLDRGDQVTGVDNLNDYYDVGLKEARLKRLTSHNNFKFIRCGIEDRDAVSGSFQSRKPDRVIHLAAQAGVRYSLTNPHAYIDANVMGFTNILEGCRHNGISHFGICQFIICLWWQYIYAVLVNMTMLTTPSASMPPQKKPMN